MEQFKDAVATNLLTFVNKEAEMSEKLVDLLIIQRDYHYSCYRQVIMVLARGSLIPFLFLHFYKNEERVGKWRKMVEDEEGDEI